MKLILVKVKAKDLIGAALDWAVARTFGDVDTWLFQEHLLSN